MTERPGAGQPVRVAGLMSGTSLDGIDAAVLEVTARRTESLPGWRLLAFRSAPYSDAQRELLRHAMEEGGARDVCLAHAWLGEWLAGALLAALEEGEIDPASVAAVGSHGQTLWHHPPRGTERGASLQVGDPATLAERTGIPVVSDFRARDLAVGGHGAPLVPWADRILYSHSSRRRALQNLGGMGNVTWLPATDGGEGAVGHEPPGRSSGVDRSGSAPWPERGPGRHPPGSVPPDEVLAFDTGPGVALLDAAAELATGGAQRFDVDGRLAASGTVDEELLERLLADPFFRRPPPRSTGREHFGTARVRELARGRGPGEVEEWRDLLATLAALTARSIGRAYREWLVPRGVDEVFLTGGGARNPELARLIREELHPLPVRDGSELPLHPDSREAAAFALLAWAHLEGVPASVPGATGASEPRVLGSLTPGGEARRG